MSKECFPGLSYLITKMNESPALGCGFWPLEYMGDRPLYFSNHSGIRQEPASILGYPLRNAAAYPDAVSGLPATEEIRESVEGLREILRFYRGGGLTRVIDLPNPVAIDPPTLLDEEVSRNAAYIVEELRRHGLSDTDMVAVSHANTPEFREALDTLQEHGVAVSPLYGPKRYPLHEGDGSFDDRSGFSLFARRYGIPAPPAQIVWRNSTNEIRQAYDWVTQETTDPVVFAKLATTGGGLAVRRVESVAELEKVVRSWDEMGVRNSLYGEGQIPVEVQGNIRGLLPDEQGSFQYALGRVITPCQGARTMFTTGRTRQVIEDDNVTWVGNGFGVGLKDIPVEYQDEVEDLLRKYQALFMAALYKEQGQHFFHSVGGIDFTLIDLHQVPRPERFMGSLYRPGLRYGITTIEHNGGRVSDAQLPLLAAYYLGILGNDVPFAAIKGGRPLCGLPDAWEQLVKMGLNWDPARNNPDGIIPWAWFEGPNGVDGMDYSNLLIVATEEDNLQRTKDTAFQILIREGLWE